MQYKTGNLFKSKEFHVSTVLAGHEVDASLTRKQNRFCKVKTNKVDGMVKWDE